MIEAKKYYYWKQPENYYERYEIRSMLDSPDGNLLFVRYQEMMMKSVSSGGYWKRRGNRPTVEAEIALVLRENLNEIKAALDMAVDLGLVMREEEKLSFIDVITNIGYDTSESLRKKVQRSGGAGTGKKNVDLLKMAVADES